MPIISKLDNELTQLLKAQITFFDNPETQGTITYKLDDGILGDYVDEKVLTRALEDIHDLKLLAAEKEFLNSDKLNGRIKKNFVSYFDKNSYIHAEIIKKDGKITEVKATGNLVDLILSEYPVTAIINELVVAGQIKEEQINIDALLTEAVRRIQLKADLINYTNNWKIYLGGNRNRLSYEWFSIVYTTLSGYLREKIRGTNHLMMAFAFDLPVEGYLTEEMWADRWDKKDIAPLRDEKYNDWGGFRVTTDQGWGTVGDILLYEKSPFDTLHYIQHANKEVIVEWDDLLANDTAADFKELQVIKKISKKS